MWLCNKKGGKGTPTIDIVNHVTKNLIAKFPMMFQSIGHDLPKDVRQNKSG